MHATKEARKKHAVAECSSPSSSSSNSAHNPVVSLRDTSTNFHSGVDAESFIVNFNNDLENVTKLKEFLETNSPDEPTRIAWPSPRHHAEVRNARASRRLRSAKRLAKTTVLDTSAILDIVGAALANSMQPWYFDLTKRNERSHDDERCLGAHVCRLNTFM